jgi:hypothetical protein
MSELQGNTDEESDEEHETAKPSRCIVGSSLRSARKWHGGEYHGCVPQSLIDDLHSDPSGEMDIVTLWQAIETARDRAKCDDETFSNFKERFLKYASACDLCVIDFGLAQHGRKTENNSSAEIPKHFLTYPQVGPELIPSLQSDLHGLAALIWGVMFGGSFNVDFYRTRDKVRAEKMRNIVRESACCRSTEDTEFVTEYNVLVRTQLDENMKQMLDELELEGELPETVDTADTTALPTVEEKLSILRAFMRRNLHADPRCRDQYKTPNSVATDEPGAELVPAAQD